VIKQELLPVAQAADNLLGVAAPLL